MDGGRYLNKMTKLRMDNSEWRNKGLQRGNVYFDTSVINGSFPRQAVIVLKNTKTAAKVKCGSRYIGFV